MALDEKEWTIMFYFASDNPLAPEIVSQLKSIKQAGFHPEVNVVAQFDPHTENTPTHIFDINRIEKRLNARANATRLSRGLDAGDDHKIGFIGFNHRDPYIVNLMPDKIWGGDERGDRIREQIKASLGKKGINHEQPDPPPPPRRAAVIKCEVPEHMVALNAGNSYRPQEMSPKESLQSFLKFCSDNYPARHYVLFILGHGVVVGNDIFLFDEHAAQSSLLLAELREVLIEFKGNVEKRDGIVTGSQFELIGFHSCSMSSMEVAFELEGTANFMLASQGPAFVGSWPYRQILVRIFNDLRRGRSHFNDPATGRSNIRVMLKKIFAYCLYNSYDFIVAGYDYEVCLSDLNRLRYIKEPLSALTAALIDALSSKRALAEERILLAHWDAQSYWKENYTDLYDFCFRLRRRCLIDEANMSSGLLDQSLEDIFNSCGDVTQALEKETKTSGDRFIVRSEFAGTSVQYSNGMSVYFPWSVPQKAGFLEEYKEYKFIRDFKENSWFDFLSEYFLLTRRDPRSVERPVVREQPANLQADLLEEFATSVFNVDGQLSKPGPGSPTGDDDCDYLSIKNYPLFTRVRKDKRASPWISMEERQRVSETFFDDPPQDDPASSEENAFLSEFV